MSNFSPRSKFWWVSPRQVAELGVIAYKQARRWAIIAIGFTILLIGTVMLLLPGPGLLVMLVGLAILATEFVWAARLLRQLKKMGNSAKQAVMGLGRPNAASKGAKEQDVATAKAQEPQIR
ncbi:MAG: PGPGW domain-containing protein [Phycisphaeraceae bacterium]|nr:PGPGW domain-containing protein [Phycisphaeraceae bacterium]